ncbi:propionyl-CoA carboxylase alpha chain [Salinibacter ruber]|uniref:Propionyl-CoA carboxylase alpha chain n=1 Tax=Salinibacter ruber TaxID=146919 RepID=A0A9X2U7D6_9BACT|nr:propionyl-CoA carboxylase alpha chain [Salinibacter ruber]MCS3951057.1 propionyl-CoA carboxylase alpha chain [Salinibacter ruber]MCS4153004.1 propionyl-CoA carboxylase alpha chain [Salinibacter ruber]MCS4168818.1 propionyl-CoA carboxylase alpha chain [Salinibacter ruber]MCS4185589.1 propionyl-CoA carboxylase alpha chain [Salinibacter ruber]
MTSRPFDKVLVANRGEIALRVLRTCHEQGLNTVAVYSTPDRSAPHVRRADEAYHIGPAEAAESYLDQEAILEAARRSGADAIHPGYGFLSENADFAEACAEAGVHFVGPPPEAIRAMGDKTAARQLMKEAGVPMAPGTTDAVASTEEGEEIAEDIGYPVLIKAAAGGGGKGMRIVHEPENFAGAMDRAQGEAESSFGDGRVFIEKYIEEPRHIEFQILADHHGNTVHLFERECSIQRRHQKVIEEAPSSVLTPAVRREMGEAAVAAAESCGYRNAGTVEFLVDADLNYYFMEMNTRLQVEHPVTEWVTGVDLVAEQLRVAQGEALGYATDDLSINGHAMESRVYAEDPASNFLPDPGPLKRHSAPSGVGVRVDAGVEEGGEVLIHYDPMISKLTTWGKDRTAAIDRMIRALDEYEVASMATTIPFCRFAMEHEGFRAGDFTTHFVDEEFDPAALQLEDPERDELAALAATLYYAETQADEAPTIAANGREDRSPWRQRRRP